MAGRGHATAAPRRVRKSRRLMTNLRVDPLHFSPEPRWRALAPTGASQVPVASASGSFGTCRRGRVGVAPVAPTRVQDLSFEIPCPLPWLAMELHNRKPLTVLALGKVGQVLQDRVDVKMP